MIPRIKTGNSFKGAGLYYLHDKRAEGEQVLETKQRVAWTYAINTLEDDPEAVLAEMRVTAFNQFLLKMESGNRIDGRPCEKPVMTVALAWPQSEIPTQQEMIETGHSFLQHMKWEGHQVLFVAHNDTKHPHVHLIINRVHPETGMTQDAAWTKHRSQQWALKYEREHGRIYCEARERKYGSDGSRTPDGMTQREWRLWQEISKENAFDPEYRRKLEAGEWTALKDGQREARLDFWSETGKLRNELRTAVREAVKWEFAKEWQDYAKLKDERDRAKLLYDREARRAIRELRRQRSPQRTPRNKAAGELTAVRAADGRTYIKRRVVESQGIERIRDRKHAYHQRQREELWELRKRIYERQKARFEALATPALARLGEERAKAYDTLLAAQRGEKSELRRDQREGERRHDLLSQYTADSTPTPLTDVQRDTYIRQALRAASRQEQFGQAKHEVGAAKPRSPADQAQSSQTTKSDSEEARRASVQALVDRIKNGRGPGRGGRGGRSR